MRVPDERLTMPIYVKTDAEMEWPDHPSFYMLTASGLFLCRNHPFFRSCVPARTWPAELARQSPRLRLRYPLIPTAMIERIVGFFSRIADLHGSEAAVLLLWDSRTERMSAHAPNQHAGVSESWTGRRYPLDVRYEQPLDLPEHLTVIGDVHSHVEGEAYSSATDREDERHRPGLHLVVGRISREPPAFHCETVVDGTRFEVDPSLVMAKYHNRRDDFPREWIDRVRVEVSGSYYSYPSYPEERSPRVSYGGPTHTESRADDRLVEADSRAEPAEADSRTEPAEADSRGDEPRYEEELRT